MKILNYEISKNLLTFILSLGVISFAFFFFLTTSQIGYSVERICFAAQTKYEGDCVEALSVFLDDEENSFRDRNSAVWALGQLGDERALPVLEKYYTGNIPERESLDAGISQYELRKAINLLKDGINLGSWTWRDGELKDFFN